LSPPISMFIPRSKSSVKPPSLLPESDISWERKLDIKRQAENPKGQTNCRIILIADQSLLCIYTDNKQQQKINYLNIPMKLSPYGHLDLLITFGYRRLSEQLLFLLLLLLSLSHVPPKIPAFIAHCFLPL